MIDVYATTGTFPDKHRLAVDFATAVMTICHQSDPRGGPRNFLTATLVPAGFRRIPMNDAQMTAGRQRPASIGREHHPALVGAAAGLLQTGQRLGTSAGIAAAGAAFFATLHGHGSYASAYRNGVFVTAAITVVALILTLTDRHRAALVHADQGDHGHHEH
jgi:hypothetical protein